MRLKTRNVIGVAVFLILILGVPGCWIVAAIFPPQEELASTGDLVRAFDELVFHSDDGTEQRRKTENPLLKWTRPITYVLTGREAEAQAHVIRRFAEEVAPLTGLDWKIAHSLAFLPGNVEVFVDSREAILNLKSPDGKKARFASKVREGVRCFASFHTRPNNLMDRALAFVPTDRGESEIRGCTAHELGHVLGFRGHTVALDRSVMGLTAAAAELDWLTLNDRLLLRALYDPRLNIGVWRDEGLPIARRIIEELVDLVEAEGPKALEFR